MYSRRWFFWGVVDELLAGVERLRGRPSFKLNALPELDDEALGQIIPVPSSEAHFYLEAGSVWGKAAADRKAVCLFACGGFEESLFQQFDGQKSLRDLGGPEFSKARTLFLRLAALELAFPINPPGAS